MDALALIGGTRAEEIGASVEAAIRGGRLRPGQPLPPVRRLAEHLAISPSTVAAAYRELRARGLVTAAGRNGTRVGPRPPLAAPFADALPQGVRDLASGNPDPALLPALVTQVSSERRLYGDAANFEPLLELARSSFNADGIAAGQVAVVGGALDGIERVLGAHLRAGDRVAVEDPCYAATRHLLLALGLEPVPVAIDDAGMLPEALAGALRGRLEALVVVPRAQNPTGAALDSGRAEALATLLRTRPEVLVIEDDHAGPIAGVPLHSLTQRAGTDRWAYVRSVSKWLGPDLRVAVLAGDAVTVSRVDGRQRLGTGWVSHLLQRMVVELWSDPEVLRLVKHAAEVYRRRREGLIATLAAHGIRARGRSGLNVWIEVDDEQAALARLLEAGFAAAPGERFRLHAPPGIRIGSAVLREGEAELIAAALTEERVVTDRARSG
ncbi:MAG TPA: aminotransferase class I/II-fold pyridoxal phosphate-dependent enzyme [Candidatus Dormibacteraeota bacterium]|nr:aminotransferase class I/II-fold pyridoxal phosphate-dependent enzyme [Candidatus Dormibacteraeota bacterium]